MNESIKRKNTPVFSGVIKYFPDAIKEVARVSYAGNQQHHKDKPLHWDRSKSTDELDALTRHLLDAGKFDTDGQRHSAKIAWRALANLQKELEKPLIYISGRLTNGGIERCEPFVKKFYELEEKFEKEGYSVFNPARLEKKGWGWDEYMKRDLDFIRANEPIMFMMSNWKQSKGACEEHQLAVDNGLEIRYE
jgi:hypothetical protein